MTVTTPRVRGWRGYRAYLTKPHDGDTFRVLADLGFGTRAEPDLRLYDVFAPEVTMTLPARRAPGGRETTEYVQGWMNSVRVRQGTRRWWLWVETLMTATAEPDQVQTFTRYVATVWAFDDYQATGGDRALSLNARVSEFLRAHPEWTEVQP